MKMPSEITTEENRLNKNKNRLFTVLKVLAFFLGIVLIGWFVSKSNLSEIWIQLQRINVKFIFLIGITFIAYFMVSVAWMQSFYESPDNISIWSLFTIRLIGESLAQINPTNIIAGETLKALLLKRKGVAYRSSIVSLTISRFIIMLSAISLVLIGIFIFFDELGQISNQGSTSVSILIFSFSIVMVILLLVYLLQSGKGIFILPRKLLKFLASRMENSIKLPKMIDKLEEVDNELLDFYKHKKIQFFSAFTLSLLHWIMGAVEMYLILIFIGVDISFMSCIAVEVGVMVFKALGSFIPGQIGIEEMANKLMLDFVNISGSSIWITVSILRRTRQLFWITAGFILFFFIMKKTKELDNGSIIYNS